MVSFDSDELFDKLKKSKPFFVLAGPCVVESREHALKMAESIAGLF
jgi:3-deoxy-D-manno-octulosonic acid (KDO) 8-phosphate synthase